jgi:hypothetical protein
MLQSITTPGLTSGNGLVHTVCFSDALRKSNPSFSILLTSASPLAPRQGDTISERKFRNIYTKCDRGGTAENREVTNFPDEWEALLDRVHKIHQTYFNVTYSVRGGPGSSVGIATRYGLDRPGIESRWGPDVSHLYRPILRPTQPPVQWVPGLSRG